MIVLDASAAIRLLLRMEPAASELDARIRRSPESLHAPAVLDAEVLHVLRRGLLRGFLTESRCELAVQDFLGLRVVRYQLTALLDRMWALRANLSVFNASYIVLAEALGATVLTTDARLGRASGHGATVEVYPS
ncbi:type II toxin-antitoxin system VapC family toxin [soil metagenome]